MLSLRRRKSLFILDPLEGTEIEKCCECDAIERLLHVPIQAIPLQRRLIAQSPLSRQACSRGAADDTVERKRGRVGIAPTPGAVKPRRRAQRRPRRNRAVIGQIADRHRRPRLRKVPVPQLRDRLPVGEAKLQIPAVDRRRARVGNRNACPEASRPLIRHRIDHLAA